jgi:outer membrane murein-binding lipoprotein Lpp
MKPAAHRFAIASGMCVMCVVLFSGCASQIDPNRVPMSTQDLNHFQIDCRIKNQQVAMLQSMRQSRDEQFAAGMRSMMRPFSWTPDHDIAHNNTNKYIDFHINQLSYC